MGCTICYPCCRPCCANSVSDSYWESLDKEFNNYNVVRLTKKDKEEAVELYIHSFGGTESTPPEETTRWLFGWTNFERDQFPENNEELYKYLRAIGEMMFVETLEFGLISGIRDDDGTLLGVAYTFPPGHKNMTYGANCNSCYMFCCALGFPSEDVTKCPGFTERGEVVDSAVKEKSVTRLLDHSYLYILAVHTKHQGKGVGKALLEFISSAGVKDGTCCSLQADGERNPAIYRSKGYYNDETVILKDPTEKEEDLELHMMYTNTPPDLEGPFRKRNSKFSM